MLEWTYELWPPHRRRSRWIARNPLLREKKGKGGTKSKFRERRKEVGTSTREKQECEKRIWRMDSGKSIKRKEATGDPRRLWEKTKMARSIEVPLWWLMCPGVLCRLAGHYFAILQFQLPCWLRPAVIAVRVTDLMATPVLDATQNYVAACSVLGRALGTYVLWLALSLRFLVAISKFPFLMHRSDSKEFSMPLICTTDWNSTATPNFSDYGVASVCAAGSIRTYGLDAIHPAPVVTRAKPPRPIVYVHSSLSSTHHGPRLFFVDNSFGLFLHKIHAEPLPAWSHSFFDAIITIHPSVSIRYNGRLVTSSVVRHYFPWKFIQPWAHCKRNTYIFSRVTTQPSRMDQLGSSAEGQRWFRNLIANFPGLTV